MIDTHSHLLPGLDHGCPDMETALLMAREAAESGVTIVVCTPHLYEWDEDIIGRARIILGELRAEAEASGIALEFRLGFEVDLSVATGVEMDKLAALTIEGSQGALLLETPYHGWPPFIHDTIFRLSAAGFVPVLAHPERNDRIQESSNPLVECLNAGAVVQGTAGSLGGMFGRAPQRVFFRLIAEGLVSLVASDAHSFPRDNWTMGPMVRALAKQVSPEDIVLLTDTNPRRLLAGERPIAVRPENSRFLKRGRTWLRSG